MLHSTQRAYSTLDVSRMCQVDPATVARWCDQGRLKCFRTPGGHRRIVREDLVEFLRSHEMPVPAEIGPHRPLVLAAPFPGETNKLFRNAARNFAPVLDVQQAPDLVTALLRLGVEKPELFLLSLKESPVDPVGLIRSIRRNPATRPIRIVAVGEPQDSERGRSAVRAGAVECAATPQAVSDLLKRLAELCDEKSTRKRFRLRRGS
jgi:two-component system, OmpR family, response regulator RpaA